VYIISGDKFCAAHRDRVRMVDILRDVTLTPSRCARSGAWAASSSICSAGSKVTTPGAPVGQKTATKLLEDRRSDGILAHRRAWALKAPHETATAVLAKLPDRHERSLSRAR
jgi:hypothetical protein